MRGFLLVCLLSAVVLLTNADDSGQCVKCVERSAVTKEAADAAEKAKETPQVYQSEVYTSKVKSRINFLVSYK